MWSFQYFISDEDYIEFNRHFLYNIPSGRKSLRSTRWIVPLMLFFANLIMLLADDSILAFIIRLIVFSVACIIWWIRCPDIILRSVRKRLRKKDSAEKSLFSSRGTLVFDPQNRLIVDVNSVEETRVRFEKCNRCFETKDAFYFYYTETKSIILPMSVFSCEEEYAAFRQFAYSVFPVVYQGV